MASENVKAQRKNERHQKIDFDELYKGLNPYSEEDKKIFFGRDNDIKCLANFMRVWRLAILYGESGVGKSSILRAGVVKNLLNEAEENRNIYKSPMLAIVTFPPLQKQQPIDISLTWESENIIDSLEQKIKEELQQSYLNSTLSLPENQLSFVENLKDWTKSLGNEEENGRIYIILDQFEEYLLRPSHDENFENGFVEAFNNRDLNVHFLISLRSDAITLIDRFKGRLKGRDDDPLSHRIELKHLNDDSAKEAIVEPIQLYNYYNYWLIEFFRLAVALKSCFLMRYGFKLFKVYPIILIENEGELTNKVLSQVQITEKIGGQEIVKCDDDNKPFIETALMQLVMQFIWKNKGTQNIGLDLLKQLKDKLVEKFGDSDNFNDGKQKNVVELISEDHFHNQIDKLLQNKKLLYDTENIDQIEKILALVFSYLVTPSGSKMTYNVEGLVSHVKDESERYKLLKTTIDENKFKEIINIILQNLSSSDSRILRSLANQKYEIFHDKFCKPIYEWQKKIKDELDKKIILKGFVVQNLAYQARQRNQYGEYELSILLACTAYRITQNKQIPVPGELDRVLREVLTSRHISSWSVKQLLNIDRQISSVAFSPCGKWLACGSYDGIVRVWDYQEICQWKEEQNPPSPKELPSQQGEITSIAIFSNQDSQDSRSLLAVGYRNRTVEVYDLNRLNDCPYKPLYEFSAHPLSDRQKKKIQEPDRGGPGTLAFSCDGQWLAFGCWDNMVKVWNLLQPQPKDKPDCFFLDKDWIWSVAFHPKHSNLLAFGCRNGSIRLWNLEPFSIQDLSVHRSNKNWEDRSLDILQEKEIFTIAFSPDGKYLAAGSRDYLIYLWDIDLDNQGILINPRPEWKKLQGHKGMVRSLNFSPDSKTLISGSDDRTLRLWNLDKPNRSLEICQEYELGVSSITFAPDSSRPTIVSGSWDGQVLLAQKQNLKQTDSKREDVIIFSGHEDLVKAVAFTNNFCLVSGSYDETVRLWKFDPVCFENSRTSDPLDWKQKEVKEVRTLACSQDGQWLASGGVEGIVLWKKCVPSKFFWLLLEMDCLAGILLLRESYSYQIVKKLDDRDTRGVEFSPNGEWLAAARSDGKITLWYFNAQFLSSDPIDLNPALRLDKKVIRTVAFDPENCCLAAGGDEGTLWLWDCCDRNLSDSNSKKFEWQDNPPEEITCIALSPDKKYLAIATEGDTIHLWELDAVQLLKLDSESFSNHKSKKTLIRGRCIAFSPNGKKLASGDRAGVVRIWDLEQLDAPPIELKGHQHRINAVAFSPNGEILASASDDLTIRLWIVEAEKLVEMACRRIEGRELTYKEWKQFISEDVISISEKDKYRACPNSSEEAALPAEETALNKS